ncbi:hypothetical protein D3C77_674950 [compost metagenome]
MFNHFCTGLNGITNGFRGVCMDCHIGPPICSGLDCGVNFIDAKLYRIYRSIGRRDAAAPGQLDLAGSLQ